MARSSTSVLTRLPGPVCSSRVAKVGRGILLDVVPPRKFVRSAIVPVFVPGACISGLVGLSCRARGGLGNLLMPKKLCMKSIGYRQKLKRRLEIGAH